MIKLKESSHQLKKEHSDFPAAWGWEYDKMNAILHSAHIYKENIKSLKIVYIILFLYFAIELAIGIYAKSISVIADSFHSFTATAGILIALIASFFAVKKPNFERTFGLRRSEIIGALLNGFLLLGMAIFVLWMSIMRLMNPVEVLSIPMIVAAIGGIIVGAISLWILWKKQKANLNVEGAFLHTLQTTISSLFVLIGAIIIFFTGFVIIDSLLGLVFGIVLISLASGILKESFNILLEKTPKNINLKQIKKEIENLPEVKNVHHIHAWSISSGKNVFSAHVRVPDVKKSAKLQKKIDDMLKKKHNIYFSTIQIEGKNIDEKDTREINLNLKKSRKGNK